MLRTDSGGSTQPPTFSAGVQQAGREVLTLEDLLHHVVGVHPRVVHPLQLGLHGVLLHRVSAEDAGELLTVPLIAFTTLLFIIKC